MISPIARELYDVMTQPNSARVSDAERQRSVNYAAYIQKKASPVRDSQESRQPDIKHRTADVETVAEAPPAEELRDLLNAVQHGKLRIVETYHGRIEHLGSNSATAVFEVEDDIVEHIYGREQFIDQQLPSQGEKLAVYVHLITEPDDEARTEDELAPENEYEREEPLREKIQGDLQF